MNGITVKMELCAEDRARLDRLAAALERYTHKCDACATSVATAFENALKHVKPEQPAEEPKEPTQERTEAAAHPVEGVEAFAAPVAEKTAPTTEEKPEEVKPKPTVKMSDIQQKVVALSAAGKKAEVKAIVTAYAERVTTIPEDKWGEVFEQLTALEG